MSQSVAAKLKDEREQTKPKIQRQQRRGKQKVEENFPNIFSSLGKKHTFISREWSGKSKPKESVWTANKKLKSSWDWEFS